METLQLVIVVLASVVVGALIPIIVMLCVALHRAGREITATSRLLAPTLVNLRAISERVEALSRGLEGGEKRVAELMSALGERAQGMERNMQLVQVATTVIAAAVPAIGAFIEAMRAPDGNKSHVEGS